MATKDEYVNGARVAAQILNQMGAARKERLVKRIEATNPAIAAKINANMFSFDDISNLTSQGVQALIKEIDHNDLVLSLRAASSRVQQTFMQNMSERKRAMVQEDLQSLPPTKRSEADDAQRRIMTKLDQLRTSGLIRSQNNNDVWV